MLREYPQEETWQSSAPVSPTVGRICCCHRKARDFAERIAESPHDLQDYLAEAAKSLLAEPRFLDVTGIFLGQRSNSDNPRAACVNGGRRSGASLSEPQMLDVP
jgi:hypothetical protein